jgi:hypothetical protein
MTVMSSVSHTLMDNTIIDCRQEFIYGYAIELVEVKVIDGVLLDKYKNHIINDK